MDLQQLKLMLNAFPGLLKLEKRKKNTRVKIRMKGIAPNCNIFLKVGASALLAAATTTNLNIKNKKIWRFWSMLLQVKYGGVLLIFPT